MAEMQQDGVQAQECVAGFFSPPKPRRSVPAFDAKQLALVLEEDTCHEYRKQFKEWLNNPLFEFRFDRTLEQEREDALARLQHYVKGGFISVFFLEKDPNKFFAAHELGNLGDPSAGTKMTVQFNLFAGTVLKLGTQRHRAMLEDVDSLKLIGCFALTELGYGNNAVCMETTATYDVATQEFVVHSPSPQSQKYWITNSAVHARMSVVFARLLVGGKDEGIHAFLVPIRNPDMTACTGVEIFDMGYKMGLNGVDNGRLRFTNVRIPRENLLNRYSDVQPDGTYSSSIQKPRDRFLVVADQLLSGRICIASGCIGGAKSSLATAVRYSSTRLTVGPTGLSDTPMINYLFQLRALLPLVATLYGYQFGLNYCKTRYRDQSEKDHQEVVTLICAIKPLVTWFTGRAAETCRERCGGQGYLASNLFSMALNGSHAGMTAEGDNQVLMQKVCKERLEVFRQKMRKMGAFNLAVEHVTERVKAFAANQLVEDVRNLSFLRELFRLREKVLITRLALLINGARGRNKTLYEVWMKEESVLVLACAQAFGERVVIEQFLAGIRNAQSGLQPILKALCTLYALCEVERDSSFFLTSHILSTRHVTRISKEIDLLCQELRPHALPLVEAFGLPPHLLTAPVANDWVKANM